MTSAADRWLVIGEGPPTLDSFRGSRGQEQIYVDTLTGAVWYEHEGEVRAATFTVLLEEVAGQTIKVVGVGKYGGIPSPEVFGYLRGVGTPIIIDTTTGDAYFRSNTGVQILYRCVINELIGARITGAVSPSICVPDPYYLGPNGDPYWNDVVFLGHFDGDEGATTTTDSSASARRLNAEGAAILTRSPRRFGSACISIPSNGSRFTCANWPGAQLGAGDFTVEFWFYLPTAAASGGHDILSCVSSFGASGTWRILKSNTQGISFVAISSGIATSSAIPVDSWVFVAITRTGTTLRIFINGVLAASGTTSVDFNDTGNFRIGTVPTISAFRPYYIDDLRITKGFSRYILGSAVPSAAFPDQAPTNSNGKTILSLHFGDNFSDSSIAPKTITNVSGFLDSDNKLFGKASGGWPSNSYTRIGASAEFSLGLFDLTVEGWVKFRLPGSVPFRLLRFNDSSTSVDYTFEVWKFGILRFYGGGTNFPRVIDWICPMELNTWHHVRFTRQNGLWFAALDGVPLLSTDNTNWPIDIQCSSDLTFPGASNSGAFPTAPGNMGELHVWREVALSTNQPFTPPFGPYCNGPNPEF